MKPRGNDVSAPPTREEIDTRIEAAVRARTAEVPWYPDYEAWVKKRVWQEEIPTPILWNLKRFVGELEGKTILELGSGMGGLLVRLQREGLSAIGVEVNAENCTISRYRGLRHGLKTRVVRGLGERLPLRPQTVDVVLCYEVIEHVESPERVLEEIRRVLRPGGSVFLTVPNRFSLYDYHYHLWGISFMPRTLADGIVSWLGRSKHDRSAGVQKLSEMHYYSWRRLNALCRRLGFQVIDIPEQKLLDDVELELKGGLARWVRLLRRLHLLHAAYRLARASVLSHYHVLLRPASSSSNNCR